MRKKAVHLFVQDISSVCLVWPITHTEDPICQANDVMLLCAVTDEISFEFSPQNAAFRSLLAVSSRGVARNFLGGANFF